MRWGENLLPKVLHVDDDLDYLEIVSHTLTGIVEVISTDDPEKVLDMLRQAQFDAVLTDYEMPGMNGVELLKKIHKEKPQQPVILLTGQGNEEVARNAFTSGAADYFTKDIFCLAYRERLLNIIKKCIKTKQAEEQIKSLSLFPRENPNPVIRIERGGQVIYCNDAGRKVLCNIGCGIDCKVPEN